MMLGSHATGRCDQLRRAAVSVEANIVEGYALGTSKLFRRHLRIASGSAAEAERLARLAGELRYLPEPVVEELGGLLGGTMRGLHGALGRARRQLPQVCIARDHSPLPPVFI